MGTNLHKKLVVDECPLSMCTSKWEYQCIRIVPVYFHQQQTWEYWYTIKEGVAV